MSVRDPFVSNSLKKLDVIISSLKANLSKETEELKDEFHLGRHFIKEKISEVETFLARREEIKSMQPRDVLERCQLNQKIEASLKEIQDGLKALEVTLRAHKKRPKKYDEDNIKEKESAKRELEDRFFHARNKFEGVVVLDEEEIIIERKKSSVIVEREMYEEEKEAIENFDQQQFQQDKDLDVLKEGVKELKVNVKIIGREIENIGLQAINLSKNAKIVDRRLQTTNQKLKNFLTKLRSYDKVCIDIILFLVLLGLVAVLVGIIKSKLK